MVVMRSGGGSISRAGLRVVVSSGGGCDIRVRSDCESDNIRTLSRWPAAPSLYPASAPSLTPSRNGGLIPSDFSVGRRLEWLFGECQCLQGHRDNDLNHRLAAPSAQRRAALAQKKPAHNRRPRRELESD